MQRWPKSWLKDTFTGVVRIGTSFDMMEFGERSSFFAHPELLLLLNNY
jgi:hypothetical protein